ncbi:hypothetical protein BGZ81_000349 [Podila clonocystis]|nr:hypothetical protein BGZ81_000349 [Podila clonocystis]
MVQYSQLVVSKFEIIPDEPDPVFSRLTLKGSYSEAQASAHRAIKNKALQQTNQALEKLKVAQSKRVAEDADKVPTKLDAGPSNSDTSLWTFERDIQKSNHYSDTVDTDDDEELIRRRPSGSRMLDAKSKHYSAAASTDADEEPIQSSQDEEIRGQKSKVNEKDASQEKEETPSAASSPSASGLHTDDQPTPILSRVGSPELEEIIRHGIQERTLSGMVHRHVVTEDDVHDSTSATDLETRKALTGTDSGLDPTTDLKEEGQSRKQRKPRKTTNVHGDAESGNEGQEDKVEPKPKKRRGRPKKKPDESSL